MKKVTIGGKPTAKTPPGTPDQWVSDRSAPTGPTKRLTIDVPLGLHQRVKSQCALRGDKMADVVRTLLEKEFGKDMPSEPSPGKPTGERHGDKNGYDSTIFSRHDDASSLPGSEDPKTRLANEPTQIPMGESRGVPMNDSTGESANVSTPIIGTVGKLSD